MKLFALVLPKKGNLREANKSKLPPLGWLTFTSAIIEKNQEASEDASDDAGLEESDAILDALEGQKTPDQRVQELLTQNPTISGATFLNVLKANGIKFTESAVAPKKESTPLASLKFFEMSEAFWKFKPKHKEAEGGATNVPVLRAAVKESMIFDRPELSFKLIESKEDGVGPTKFGVVLLTEGLGNLRDGFWYTREALNSAVTQFEGRKCYANHPSKSEEQERPERDVRDILGHFSNLRVEDAADGRAQLKADLEVPSSDSYKWARELCASAIEFQKKFPDKDLVGLSINANGSAEQITVQDLISRGIPDSCRPKLMAAVEKGMSAVKIVLLITDAVSCDLVTEAGAGGKITSIIE